MNKLLLKSGKSILLMSLLMVVSISRGQSTQTYSSNGNFITPAGVTTVKVEAYGAGGGGGYGGSSNKRGGGGGGGGGYRLFNSVSVTPGTSYPIVIGIGGSGSTGGNGTVGGNTTFATSAVIAYGGSGGKSYTNGRTGGAGGVGTYSGGDGGTGSSTGSGGGGGAGGTTVGGGDGNIPDGGTAGPGGIAGAGGDGSTSNAATGEDGKNYGGGGGGGTKNSNGGDGANGYAIITYTCPTYALTSPASVTGPYCGVSGATVTLRSSSLTSATYIVNYTLSGSTVSSGSTSMNFTAGSPGTGTFSIPAFNIGTTTITITSLTNSYCTSTLSSNNTATVVLNNAPIATAGTDINTCSTSGAVNITAGSTATNAASVMWSGGTGTFTNPTSLTLCTYTPSAAENVAGGNITLTLTAIGNTPCGNSTSTKTLTINKTMTAVAGATITTCSSAGAVNITSGSSASNQTTVTWTSSGTGTFANPNSLTTCTYTPSSADITAGNVTLTLTASNPSCPNVTSSKTLNIVSAPIAVAGTPIVACNSVSGPINITAGSSATNQTSVTWTASGTGTFANANSLTTCTYTPSVADIALGTVTLTLTAYGNSPCGSTTSNKTLSFSGSMVINAGSNVSTCSSTGAVNISTGATAVGHTSVTWTSSGTGTFANANSLSLCTYTPSAADITAGNVTITLTGYNGGCPNVTSTKTLTITTAATATAGTVINVCQNTTINITAGSSAANQTGITWTSNGTGTFTNANSLTLCTYTPSAADITAGTRILTLTANGNSPCGTVTSTKNIIISKTMTAAAGTALTTCASSGAVNITAGSSATNQTSVTWTSSGTGTFANANSLTTCTYTPSAADITAGSVTLTLTASNAGCPNVTSTKTLTIFATPMPVAGTAVSTCSNIGYQNITAGASAANATVVSWSSSGTGTFTNQASLTTCLYNQSTADITAGSVTLTLTASNAGCVVTSTKVLTILPPPTANAGTALYMCDASGPYNVTAGATAANYASVTWTSNGTGTFANANSMTLCTYSPSAADVALGGVTLTLTATGNANCANAVATKFLTITSPTATAGTAISACASTTSMNITAGASATNYTSVTWTSSGTGTFTNANSLTLCTYTPSAADKAAGTVTLTLTASAPGCSNDTSIKTLTIYASPTITGTTPGSRSGSGTVLLGATASVGTIYWYAASTGGTAIGFGTNFTTPTISVTTTYYVEAVNGSCTSSPRVAIVATVNQPEIDIQGNATTIVDGDITPTTSDWTDFGATTSTRTFTVKNTGTGVLTLGTITIGGANASDFTVTTAPSSSIASGSSTSFTITFNPTAGGTRSASVSIVNSDADENPYDFNIQGTGIAREMDVKGNAVTIVDGDSTPTTADWTDFSSTASTRTFTIYNLGNVVLTLGTPTITGTNASDFAITTAPAATVPAYGSTTITVTFSPNAINTRTATLTIPNNDADESPYDFAIQGFGIIPEIDVQGNATSIVDGDTTPTTSDWTDFSNNIATRTFTIYNQGNTTLNITSTTVSGSDFTITTPPASTVSAFSSTTFTVTFNPATTGTKTATVTILNNDNNEGTYDFKIQGTAIAQEIELRGNAVVITDGDTTPTTSDWTDFSNVTSTRTFTINNLGNLPLTISGVTFGGTNPSDFTVTTAPTSPIPAFGSTTFTVTFSSAATGVRSAVMNISNNDADENPYNVTIQATAGTRIITVTNPNNVNIADGDTTPTPDEQTDFGSVSIDSGTTVTVTYTIKNTGTAAISIGAASFTGTNASEFSMTSAPASAIAVGGSTTFDISFNPTSKGTKTATFSIVTNATGMNPFNFDLMGMGVQTYIDTDGDGITDNMDLDDDNDGIKDVKEQNDAIAYPLSNYVKYTFLNETFGYGKTKGKININTPGASTTSCYEDNITTNANNCGSNGSGVLDDGEYVVNYIITNSNGVSSDPENIHHDLAWTDQLDHTPGDVDGRMAIFNADNTAGTYFYQLIINGVLPNTVTSFDFWVMNLMRQGNLGTTILPNITVEFRDITGATLIASYNTGDIGRCSATNPSDNTCGPSLSNWLNYSTTVNLGNVTDFMIKIRNNAPGGGGNDFAMDDIVITQNYVDTDGDGVANIFDLDDENDGIPDIEEAGLKAYSNGLSKMDLSSPSWIDANGNGVNDAIDAMIAGGTYLVADTDGDGVPNYLDLDSDNDSFFDVDEANIYNGDGDINGDGKGDLADTDKDGILDLYDNNTGFGTSARAYAQDSDSDGIADYLEIDANNDGIKDITTGLYSSLDANGDGRIDGTADIDKDGILDTFDTNTLVVGSPRDLNKKLFLDFDGRNDYAESSGVLGGLSNASLMAWIDLNSAFSGTGVVVGQDKFNIRVTGGKLLQAIVNGTAVTYGTALSINQWYHVAATYGGGSLRLYLNGVLVGTQSLSGAISADATLLTLGKEPRYPLTSVVPNYFKGKIDEVRIFNTTLTAQQVQRMVYQEIQNTASQVRGAVIPKDVGTLPFSNLLRYYRMDAYKDDIIDDLTTASIDSGIGMKSYNHKLIAVQQAPMPFVTVRPGTFASAINDTTKDIRGLDATDYDYSIIQVKHDITDTANNIDLGMFVDAGVTIKMNNDTKIQNDWYLKLDGKIDLTGKSQFIQTANSDLDVTSAGSIERDQQGQSNKFNYNYWSSPVSSINNTTINHGFTVAGVMKDATDVNNIQDLQWTSGINGSPTTPLTLSSYWIFKFQNSTNNYANWSSVGSTGTLLAGQGFTLKGGGAATANQNYTFVGKPNNGNITSSVGPNNLNLCGNPYPSAIDADKFIDDNSTSIVGTLYIWEHYSTNSSHNTIAYQGGYATYTKTGGTAPVAPAGVSGLGSSSKTPKRFIPVGQGFFVTGSATGGTINFNNGQRLFIKEDNTANSYTMFKNNNVANTNPAMNNQEDDFVQEDFMKLRLGFNSTDNLHRQTLIGFMNEHATSGYDNGYDGISIETLTNDMYFINGTNKLNISGEGFFNPNNIYPIGVKNNTSGNVTFVVDAKENFDANQEIYIYDNETSTYNSIKDQSYQVNLPAGTYENRFSLRFTNGTLGTEVPAEENHGIIVAHSQSDNMISIKNVLQEVTVKSVALYNLLGQQVTEWNVSDIDQANIQLHVSDVSTGTYIVKVITDGGDITKKILVKK